MLCVNCKKNKATVFIKRVDPVNHTEITDGYCMKCIQELGLSPTDEILKSMGLSTEQVESMNESLQEMLSQFGSEDDMGGDDEGEGFASPLIMMGGIPDIFKSMHGQEPPHEEPKNGTTKTATRKKPKEKKRILDAYGTNLTVKAREQLIDRIVGRDSEISRVVQILNRRTKNNRFVGRAGRGQNRNCRRFGRADC